MHGSWIQSSKQMELVPVEIEVWIVKTCSVVWMSEDGISVTTLSLLCCATATPANRSRVEHTVVERMVKVIAMTANTG